MQQIKIVFLGSLLLIASLNVQAQKSSKKVNNTQKGGVIGAGTGAVIGGAIGSRNKNTAIGAIIGATVGGVAGAIIGNRMDKKAEQLKEELGKDVVVERVGEGIKLTMADGLLFDFNSAAIRQENMDKLNTIAQSLNEDKSETKILIEGNTDNIGSQSYNKSLSLKRARSVSRKLVRNGVASSRIKIVGLGENNPVESNATDWGRQKNRRVEIAIFASEKLQNEAKKSAENLTSKN